MIAWAGPLFKWHSYVRLINFRSLPSVVAATHRTGIRMYLTNHAYAGSTETMTALPGRRCASALALAGIALITMACGRPGNAQPTTAPAAVKPPAAAVAASASKPLVAIAPDKLQACPLEPGDFKTAFGVAVRAGKPSELNPKNGKLLDCTYFAAAGTMAVTVSQTWIEPAQLAATMASIDRYLGSTPEPIAADLDRGRWLLDPVRKDTVVLQYLRSNVRTEIRVMGGDQKPEALRPRLLKLRRVP